MNRRCQPLENVRVLKPTSALISLFVSLYNHKNETSVVVAVMKDEIPIP